MVYVEGIFTKIDNALKEKLFILNSNYSTYNISQKNRG